MQLWCAFEEKKKEGMQMESLKGRKKKKKKKMRMNNEEHGNRSAHLYLHLSIFSTAKGLWSKLGSETQITTCG